MHQGLQINPLIKNWLIVIHEIKVQRQHIFHSTNCRGNIRRCRSSNQLYESSPILFFADCTLCDAFTEHYCHVCPFVFSKNYKNVWPQLYSSSKAELKFSIWFMLFPWNQWSIQVQFNGKKCFYKITFSLFLVIT